MLLCAQNLIKIFLERALSDLRGEEKQQQNVDFLIRTIIKPLTADQMTNGKVIV